MNDFIIGILRKLYAPVIRGLHSKKHRTRKKAEKNLKKEKSYLSYREHPALEMLKKEASVNDHDIQGR